MIKIEQERNNSEAEYYALLDYMNINNKGAELQFTFEWLKSNDTNFSEQQEGSVFLYKCNIS